jgi:phage baseplate assembly protein W
VPSIRVRSIAFPFQKGKIAFPAEANDKDAIMASLIQIITTNRGERIMRPTFGCNAFSFVFESNTEEFRLKAERDIRQALATWEKRIRVNGVQISSDPVTEPGQITITVTYTIVVSGEVDTVSVAGGI